MPKQIDFHAAEDLVDGAISELCEIYDHNWGNALETDSFNELLDACAEVRRWAVQVLGEAKEEQTDTQILHTALHAAPLRAASRRSASQRPASPRDATQRFINFNPAPSQEGVEP